MDVHNTVAATPPSKWYRNVHPLASVHDTANRAVVVPVGDPGAVTNATTGDTVSRVQLWDIRSRVSAAPELSTQRSCTAYCPSGKPWKLSSTVPLVVLPCLNAKPLPTGSSAQAKEAHCERHRCPASMGKKGADQREKGMGGWRVQACD